LRPPQPSRFRFFHLKAMPAKTHQDILLMRWALFSVAGLILLVALYSLGLTPIWARDLKEAMASAPFLLPPDAPALSPGTGFLLCMALTLALVYDLLLIRGTLRKTAVLAAFLLLLASFTPVLGLWGLFFNAIPCLLSAGSAGTLAILWPQTPPARRHSEHPSAHE
jgi:hypothetical protein